MEKDIEWKAGWLVFEAENEVRQASDEDEEEVADRAVWFETREQALGFLEA